MGHHKQAELDRRSKRNARSEQNTGYVSWIDGHALTLTTAEKEQVMGSLEEQPINALTVLDELSEVGLKTSFKYDRKNDTYLVTVYRVDPEYPDAGYTLTARAKSFDRCMGALLFALEDVQDFNLIEVKSIRELASSDF